RGAGFESGGYQSPFCESLTRLESFPLEYTMDYGRRFAILVLLALPASPFVSRLAAQDKPPPIGTQSPPAMPTGKDERRQLLETVGLATASHLYQAYLNIGLLADGKAEGIYEEKDVRQLLASVDALLGALDTQLDKIGKQELSKEDREGVALLRRVSGLLRQ